MFWWKLPNDIQLEVLECLTDENMAKYASVCSEWQKFFESRTMRNLDIRYDDIPRFSCVFQVEHRRRYLRHLTLVMEFPCAYRLANDRKPTRDRTAMRLYQFAKDSSQVITAGLEIIRDMDRVRMDHSFGNFLFVMFLLLSEWKQQQAWPRGIHLTIADNSRTSWQALADEFEPGETVIYSGITINTEAQEWSKRIVLAHHDWMFNLKGYMFRPMRLNPVLAITRFSSIAKYQNFDPESLMNIMTLLPSLWRFDCSMRAAEFSRNQVSFSQQMLASMDSWPSQLRDIKILRVPQARGSPALSAHSFSFLEPVSLRLARMAQNLTQLSFQQPIDAFEFFQCQQHEYRNLRSLSICSTHRILDEFPGTVNRPVLALFADTLPQMPNLQTFSLFSITEGASAVICLSPKNGGTFSLLWDWPFLLDRATLQSIQKISYFLQAYPALSGVVQAASTDEIRSQIAYINKVSE